MNRLSMDNLTEPITKDLDFQLQDPFLLYRNARCKSEYIKIAHRFPVSVLFFQRLLCMTVLNTMQAAALHILVIAVTLFLWSLLHKQIHIIKILIYE